MTTNVSRPIHLQLRPTRIKSPATCSTPSPRAQVSQASGDSSLPSQILPHLFVGNQEQTNRDTVNRLEISYILSLGLLPLISNSMQPHSSANTLSSTSTTPSSSSVNTTSNSTSAPTTVDTSQLGQNGAHHIQLPSQNSSKDYKIRLRSSSNGSDGNQQDSAEIRKLLDCDDGGENKGAVNAAVRYIQCKCINIADSTEQTNLTKFFDEAHQFIDEARKKKCNILVHCLAGISRSPTIAIAYLMKVNSLRLQDAYNLVKQCRPQIDVNLSFMGQLMIYGKRLLTSCCRPIPSRQPAGSSSSYNLAINMKPCDKNHHVNANHQSADNETNLVVEEHNCECDLSHIIFIYTNWN